MKKHIMNCVIYLLITFIFMIQPIKSSNIEKSILDQNYSAIQDLEPVDVWRYFCEISRIPRGSGNEACLASFIMQCAQQYGLSARLDNVGNVIVKKAASLAKYNNVPTVVMQAHMDMVCEKNKDIEHDFSKDPIEFVRKDNMLYAQGTTLGADNGLGVAALLAIMSSTTLIHGPLEFLFTVMEESGFDGAYAITPESFDARMLINVDTEEDGSLYIGCAGSAQVLGTLPITREPISSEMICYNISINNLRGGHSGVDIDKDRINALKIASKVLNAFTNLDIRLISLQGGNKLNAIARDVEIIFAIEKNQRQNFHEQAGKLYHELLTTYKKIEPDFTIKINEYAFDQNIKVIARNDQIKIIKLLENMPHGVITMSLLLPGLVETSTNFARITTQEDTISFATMQRGMVADKLEAIIKQVAQYMQEVGVHVSVEGRTSEWQPNEHSLLLKLAGKTYSAKFGKEPEIKAIHAGLECGAFVKQVPGLDAISFGPTIIDAHSPNEHLAVDMVQPFWVLLTGLLEVIALKG